MSSNVTVCAGPSYHDSLDATSGGSVLGRRRSRRLARSRHSPHGERRWPWGTGRRATLRKRAELVGGVGFRRGLLHPLDRNAPVTAGGRIAELMTRPCHAHCQAPQPPRLRQGRRRHGVVRRQLVAAAVIKEARLLDRGSGCTGSTSNAMPHPHSRCWIPLGRERCWCRRETETPWPMRRGGRARNVPAGVGGGPRSL